MTDYRQNTGNSGTLIIRDDGYNVWFLIENRGTQTYANGKSWSGVVNGVGVGGTFSIGPSSTITVAGAYGVGYTQNVSFTMGATGTTGLAGPSTITVTLYRATVPGQPGTPVASNVQPTQMDLSWAIPGNGGAAIDQMLLRRSLTPDFASYADYPLGGNVSSHTPTGLTPGTTYYWRVYAHNSVGYSASSGILTQATLPATAPGMTVTPSISGTSSTVTLTPPGGASGVTKYTVERRLFGTTTPVTTTESASSPIAQPGLTPGTSYEYRASAWFGTYQSPWTGWVAAVQPNPNTGAGAHWDGNTPDTPSLDYGWTGAVGNSTSTATGRVPTGWRTFAQSAVTSGGTGAVFQASGGFQGSWSARAAFFTDTTAYGFAFGTASTATSVMADIEEGALYFGSVYTYPSKTQRLQPVINWYNAGGAFISSSVGAASVVTTVGARLSTSATAPVGAQWASIHVANVSGTSSSLWLGGDWLQLDAAMISLQSLYDYFDGDTPDTTQYQYDWLGAPNASASSRTLATQTDDLLADPDCDPIPGAPQPPLIDTSCIITVGTWRRYWAVIPESEVYEWVSVVPTITVTTGGIDARQVRIRFHPNPDNLPPEAGLELAVESEQIISYIPANTVMTLDGVSEMVWASVNGGADIPANHLLYGSDGGPATWPTLTCGDSYLVSFDVPLDAPAGSVSIDIALTMRMV